MCESASLGEDRWSLNRARVRRCPATVRSVVDTTAPSPTTRFHFCSCITFEVKRGASVENLFPLDSRHPAGFLFHSMTNRHPLSPAEVFRFVLPKRGQA